MGTDHRVADPMAASAIVASKPARLFILLSGLFVTNALIAEFVGVKIFALEDTLGLSALGWRLFGQSGSLSFTAGVMLWPIVFVMTDIVNEHFGVRGVRLISWLAVGFIAYAFLFAYLAIGLAPAGWWVTVGIARGVPDMQAAFASVFGKLLMAVLLIPLLYLGRRMIRAYLGAPAGGGH